MRREVVLIKAFARFALISGLGWLCDLIVFAILLRIFDLTPAVANSVSSWFGLTLVYFTSLRIVFHKYDGRRARFIFTYWAFQCISILTYSLAIGWLMRAIGILSPEHLDPRLAGIGAKVLVTPLTLCTNFLFMRLLSHFMMDAPKLRGPLILTEEARR
jgi:putative flippase GtrA